MFVVPPDRERVSPHADDLAVRDEDRAHHAVHPGPDRTRDVRGQRRRPIAVRQVRLLERRQGEYARRRRGGPRQSSRPEEPVAEFDEKACGCLGRVPCRSHRQARPPREVVGRRGPVPVDVAHEEIGERVGRRGGVRDPFVREHEVLLPGRRTVDARDDGAVHEHPAQRQHAQQVHPALPARVDARGFPHREQFGAGKPPAPGQRRARDPLGAGQDVLVDAEFAQAPRHGALLPLPRDRQDPGQVGGGKDVDRAALRPGADDPTGIERRVDVRQPRFARRPHAECPPSAPEFLRLHSQQMSGRRPDIRRGRRQPMRAQPRGAELSDIHRPIMARPSDTARTSPPAPR